MVKRKLPRSIERNFLIRVNTFLEGKTKTSTKKVKLVFGISGRRASMILTELGWIRDKRNGASGTVYRRFDGGIVYKVPRGKSYTLAPGKHGKSRKVKGPIFV